MVQRPVILPPLEAGSDRCSVKPASRRSCHFRSREAQGFRLSLTGHYQLGTGRPAQATETAPNIHATLMPPLGSQALATELGEYGLTEWPFKLVLRAVYWRGGTKAEVCD
ncbi:hypothetical protein HU200_035841 [Digitaria exilis]|uniref:Uncharacterized protein n=1 Tax=Digitaria exilis TaxID=1010633 RepID=A0A835BI06_9POAL|nr:hypothetical protein HU200_035841 [Digitaria exilis]CAB3466953.1 unnamed protein product [Digitaria exilis]